ncbi:helix-turn-helix domain-containing protein [Streptomyces sp. NPDC127106]|uniref:helix-turn-helix domain-containing protein n=1 Tax=Streptomyces sp. NPDC127106 TaxID=3345360 RepID=UPI003634CDC1
MGLHEDIDPSRARNAAELVALMRKLQDRSGLSYRQLENRAATQGRVLTRSTISYVLTRPSLPRPDMLAAFVAACGHEPETDAWLAARERLAAEAEADAGSTAAPAASAGSPQSDPAPGTVPAGRLRSRRVLAVLGTAVAALGLGYGLAKGIPGAAQSPPAEDTPPSATPAKQPATGFTLFEGRSLKGTTAASVGYRFWDTGDGWFGIEYVTPYSRDEPDAYQDGWGGKLRMHYEDRFGTHTVDLTDNPDGEPDAGKDDIRYGAKNVWFEVCDSDGRDQLRGCQRLRKART